MHSDQGIVSLIIQMHSYQCIFAGPSQAYLWIPLTFPIDLERTPMQGARQPQKITRIIKLQNKLQKNTKIYSLTFLLSVRSVKPLHGAGLRV